MEKEFSGGGEKEQLTHYRNKLLVFILRNYFK
jgi:hypothetical protein